MYETTNAAEGLNVPILITALHSQMDAGQVAAIISQHLLDSLQHERVATFDADSLIDFRKQRPTLTFEKWHFTEYDEPEIALELLSDDEGRQLLLLHGNEPDLKWHGFVQDVLGMIERFGVDTTISVQGIPMGLPHTRPAHLSLHGTNPELRGTQPEIFGTMQVPGHVSGLLELRLGERGQNAAGIAAGVPHYLSGSPYSPAAAAAVRKLAEIGGLALPVGELEAASARLLSEVNSQIEEQDEVTAIVGALERQYDSFAQSQPHLTDGNEERLPTADEIGGAVEAFLADLGEDFRN
ncbi:Predicted ATP-dependent carboligase, ATP-grasp superfamily [Ruaniaceae bacterium KH17]|nr:Predicted ATP-dependent carboligase, ATP-grasp superfamily [Ruaniaceae bacterium KH17]